ncbi:MAG: 3-dehydroquinate synthase [Muribaculum sp.]|nr:3-dehydroquinate synthase [Muribaculum sp.]
MSQTLIFTNDVSQALRHEIERISPDKVFVFVDRNTRKHVLPRIELPVVAEVVMMDAGDEAKTLDTLANVWRALTDGGATRHSLMINVGGGVVTDLGGFAAATFKRGIRFVNVPTTLLAAVDASVGGKTGINFCGLKNEIGVFAEAESVIISTVFFSTLSREELLSGYAEMLKHGMLSGRADVTELMSKRPEEFEADEMLAMLRRSVAVKEGVVARDPKEKGERKILNLGHTVGHAIESLALRNQKPVAHGYAVAWGMLTELVLSHMELGFDSALLHVYADYVAENYGSPAIDCEDYPALLELMGHDKKNVKAGTYNFTLMRQPGEALYDRIITDRETIMAALDITRDLLHM